MSSPAPLPSESASSTAAELEELEQALVAQLATLKVSAAPLHHATLCSAAGSFGRAKPSKGRLQP